ncbi:Utr2 GPI anchored cell wall putative glycosidase [Scheffersomyces amazonensis]|uniref:Utr2 GPI anchored cell wall putative glycosidase n=1 Tax=Scheffersomyces amazonensis TaxID=1078765 RepID=UPI00315D6586
MFISQSFKWTLIPIIFSTLLSHVLADTPQTFYCNTTSQCPEEYPCCSQYGQCGTGAYCLGGCDIRYSFNLSSCMPMPRMDSFSYDFTDINNVELQTDYLGNASEADFVYSGWVAGHNNALLLQMPNETTGTVVSSTKYLWFGKVGATLKTSHDAGVITAFILFSDIQDEIDFEFLGYNLTAPQTNFYYEGILNYTNARNSSTTNTFEYYHTYEIDWTIDSLSWYIDGQKVRTLNKNDTYNETTKVYNYPQTPSRIQFSLWPGGDSLNGLGTIEWAGGAINWDSQDIQQYGYYYAYVQNITVEAYDLPPNVPLQGSKNASDLQAYLYNSTAGGQGSVYLTNKQTWLGASNATGFDPQNNKPVNQKNTTSTIVTTSGSKVITKTTIHTTNNAQETVNGPPAIEAGTTNGGDNQAQATTTYNTNGGIGGFVQNSQETATDSKSSGSSGSGSSSASGIRAVGSIVALVGAMAIGFVSFFM